MTTKTQRVAVLFDPSEKALLDEAMALYAKERGMRSIPKASVLLRDVLMAWAEKTVETARNPSLFPQIGPKPDEKME